MKLLAIPFCIETAMLFAALRKAGVPVEMHLYASGAHALELRRTNVPFTQCPRLVETRLKTIGMIS
jgi:acetyl esterase/lipase